jgi:hypothetical protein
VKTKALLMLDRFFSPKQTTPLSKVNEMILIEQTKIFRKLLFQRWSIASINVDQILVRKFKTLKISQKKSMRSCRGMLFKNLWIMLKNKSRDSKKIMQGWWLSLRILTPTKSHSKRHLKMMKMIYKMLTLMIQHPIMLWIMRIMRIVRVL